MERCQMATIDTLKEKVQNATETVAKRDATIVRHEKQLEKKIKALVAKGCNIEGIDFKAETVDFRDIKWDENGKSYDWYWEACEVDSKLRDIKSAKKNLVEANRILGNWQEKLDTELEKERFLNNETPQVILDFLNKWKEMAFDWHVKRYADYLEFVKEINKAVEEARKTLGIRESMMPSRAQSKELQLMELDYRTVEKRKASFAGTTVLKMKQISNEDERLKFLDNVLEKERKAKMLDLIERITCVTGKITDVSGLKISAIGSLNGIVIGEKASAKIETIGAGGYAIQCFHYRTLIHKLTA